MGMREQGPVAIDFYTRAQDRLFQILIMSTRLFRIDLRGRHRAGWPLPSRSAADWDALLNADDIGAAVSGAVARAEIVDAQAVADARLLPPIGIAGSLGGRRHLLSQPHCPHGGIASRRRRQLLRSRLRCRAARAVLQGHAASRRRAGRPGRIRPTRAGTSRSRSWRWSSTARGTIVGYTIGNDMSSRDIEGENPLYLPQAKVYAACCALGPAVLVGRGALSPETAIQLEIRRDGTQVFAGSTDVAMLKRTGRRARRVPVSRQRISARVCAADGHWHRAARRVLLQQGDEIAIAIPPIGTLRTVVQLGGTAVV